MKPHEQEGSLQSDALGAPVISRRILLVDDHPGVRATTAALLTDLGHEVAEAPGGPEALAMLKEDSWPCDLVITDYAMPSISGVELVRQMRQFRPDLPAIIITGYADTGTITNRPDDVNVVGKPFTPERLNLAISGAGRRQATSRAD